jgi:hypothetical protein
LLEGGVLGLMEVMMYGGFSACSLRCIAMHVYHTSIKSAFVPAKFHTFLIEQRMRDCPLSF